MNSTPKSKPIFTGIQALRGVAAMLVVMHHILEELANHIPQNSLIEAVTRVGACGVDIFFVISGFIMMQSTSELHRSPRTAIAARFLIGRIIRVAPLYWMLCLFTLAMHSTGFFYRSKTVTLLDSIKSMLFIPNENMLIGVGWTLNYEFSFYLMFAAGLLAANYTSRAFTIISLLIIVFLISIAVQPSTLSLHFGNTIIFEFALGISVAKWTHAKVVGKTKLTFLLILSAAFIFVFSWWENSNSTNGIDNNYRFLVWGIPAAAIVFLVRSIDNTPKFLKSLGDSSYSLYLVHSFIMTALALVLIRHPPRNVPFAIIYGTVAAIFSLMMARVIYLLVEVKIDRVIRSRFVRLPAMATTVDLDTSR